MSCSFSAPAFQPNFLKHYSCFLSAHWIYGIIIRSLHTLSCLIFKPASHFAVWNPCWKTWLWFACPNSLQTNQLSFEGFITYPSRTCGDTESKAYKAYVSPLFQDRGRRETREVSTSAFNFESETHNHYSQVQTWESQGSLFPPRRLWEPSGQNTACLLCCKVDLFNFQTSSDLSDEPQFLSQHKMIPSRSFLVSPRSLDQWVKVPSGWGPANTSTHLIFKAQGTGLWASQVKLERHLMHSVTVLRKTMLCMWGILWVKVHELTSVLSGVKAHFSVLF